METTAKQERIEKLYQLIAAIGSLEDCQALFEDLCTAKEIENMAERLQTENMKAAITSGLVIPVNDCWCILVRYGY